MLAKLYVRLETSDTVFPAQHNAACPAPSFGNNLRIRPSNSSVGEASKAHPTSPLFQAPRGRCSKGDRLFLPHRQSSSCRECLRRMCSHGASFDPASSSPASSFAILSKLGMSYSCDGVSREVVTRREQERKLQKDRVELGCMD
jgi:hypothetical protein